MACNDTGCSEAEVTRRCRARTATSSANLRAEPREAMRLRAIGAGMITVKDIHVNGEDLVVEVHVPAHGAQAAAEGFVRIVEVAVPVALAKLWTQWLSERPVDGSV